MIEIQNLSIELGEFCLNDVSLTVEDGEYYMLLGPTGAGKTILLETLAGIYKPKTGRILLNGRDITNLPPRKRHIGMVYQDYMLFPHLTVDQNIRFGLKYLKRDPAYGREKASELAELLGISHLIDRHPGTLSGGERQRAAIARALIVEPEVLLLDEPLSALDTETRRRLREELHLLHSGTKMTMLHVTHSFHEAFLLGTQMAIMNNGQVVQVGPPREVFRKPNSMFSAEFLGVINTFEGESVVKDGLAHIRVNGMQIISTVPKAGPVHVCVRPEVILASLELPRSSAQNIFPGKIESIVDEGIIASLHVDAGLPFTVAVTQRSLEDLNLREGHDVYLSFKATEVHVF